MMPKAPPPAAVAETPPPPPPKKQADPEPSAPVNQPVSQQAPPLPQLDMAILDRLEEKIMGQQLGRATGSLREAQNLRGVFHSTPAGEAERRVTESHRDRVQAGEMSLLADQQSNEMRRLSQMQTALGQQVQSATDKYNSAYSNYANQYNNWASQQQNWGQAAGNWMAGSGQQQQPTSAAMPSWSFTSAGASTPATNYVQKNPTYNTVPTYPRTNYVESNPKPSTSWSSWF